MLMNLLDTQLSEIALWRNQSLSRIREWLDGLKDNGLAADGADAEFDRLFFGIWLSDATSEPALRQALLAQTAR